MERKNTLRVGHYIMVCLYAYLVCVEQRGETKMTDKIQEELEKEIEEVLTEIHYRYIHDKQDSQIRRAVAWALRRNEEATKQAMIKEFEKMIDESRLLEVEKRELKQKLGELKNIGRESLSER